MGGKTIKQYFLINSLLIITCWAYGQPAPGCPAVDAGPDQSLNCSNSCATLQANAFHTGLTTTYTVSSIPYNPPYPFTGGTSLFINIDDIWSNVINLPFTFCFYGTPYNQIVVGANGVLSFDISLANGWCEWNFNAPIPTPGPPPTGIYNNSINGAYHDMDPGSLNAINADINYAVLGTAPCRTFVVNFYRVPHFDCDDPLFGTYLETTQQIVLYETTNVIEVYIQEKPVCAQWNNGNAVIGLQNGNGTQGITPPGRNTGPWSAYNEAWRFTPNGPANYDVRWLDGGGNVIATTDTVTVCPSSTTTYTAEARYFRCQGDTIIVQDQVTINITGGINNTTASTDETCAGACDGSITINTSGGTPPYSYDIGNGPQPNGVFNNLCAGTYQVTISDNGGCQAVLNFTINAQQSLTVNALVSPVTCTGLNNGFIDLTVGGGSPPYSYSWSNAATTQDIFNLTAGTYSVTISDMNGCSIADTFNITSSPSLNLTYTKTDVACYGDSTGSIDLTVTGGAAPYTFIWSNSATTEDLTGIPAGTYSVTVTDTNGCQGDTTIVINQPDSLHLTMMSYKATCGASNGALDLTVTGGVPPYTFIWSNSATTEDISNIPAGTYYVTVTDSNGCTKSGGYLVANTSGAVISAVLTHVTCNGGSDGSIDLTVTTAPTPYQFNWSNSATTEDLTNISAGTYSVTVTDSAGCMKDTSFTITEPPALQVQAAATDPLCAGDSTGAIDITVSGGITPYTYAWSSGQTTEDLQNIPAGNYNLTVTDANACTITSSYQLNNPAPLQITNMLVNHVSCYGNADGSIDITISGGTGGYVYQWQDGATTEDRSNLPPGNYIFTVSDTNGCSIDSSAAIIQPPPIVVTAVVNDVTCSGANDGLIDLTVSGGIPSPSGYGFNWSNGSGSEDLFNIGGGVYTVTITDDNGCTNDTSFTVNEPAQLAVQLSTQHISCYGADDGMVTAFVSGGIAPYTYQWSNLETTASITGLSAGIYGLTVTDTNGCQVFANTTITEPGPLILTADTTHATCNLPNGSVIINVSGGTTPYTYLWNDGNTNPSLINIYAGNYVVTVMDNNGCTLTQSFTLHDSPDLVCDAGPDDSLRIGNSIRLSPYISDTSLVASIDWSPATDISCISCIRPEVSPLTTTTYTIRVTDWWGCVYTDEVTIIVFSRPTVYVPNAFSPDGDDNNEIFRVYGTEIATLNLRIFDRWGQKLFESNDINQGWDGTYKGEPLPPGVYTYTVEIYHLDGTKSIEKGSVTLLR